MVDLDSLRDQAETAWQAGLWKLAQVAYAAIVEEEPTDRLAGDRLIECLKAQGEHEHAAGVVVKILERLESRGDLQGALTLTEALLAFERPAALERAFRLHFLLADTDSAIAKLQQLSDHYLDSGQVDEAIAVFDRAQREFPQCVDIGMELGNLYIAMGYIDEGTEQFRRVAHSALDHDLSGAMEAFRRWDFLKRLREP